MPTSLGTNFMAPEKVETGCDPNCKLRKATGIAYRKFDSELLGLIEAGYYSRTDSEMAKKAHRQMQDRYQGISFLHIAGAYCKRSDAEECAIRDVIEGDTYNVTLGSEVLIAMRNAKTEEAGVTT